MVFTIQRHAYSTSSFLLENATTIINNKRQNYKHKSKCSHLSCLSSGRGKTESDSNSSTHLYEFAFVAGSQLLHIPHRPALRGQSRTITVPHHGESWKRREANSYLGNNNKYKHPQNDCPVPHMYNCVLYAIRVKCLA